MKWVLGGIVLMVVVFFVIFKSGMMTMEDPAVAAKGVEEHVKNGMTWQEVAAFREPVNISAVSSTSRSGRADERRYDQTTIEMINRKTYNEGFIFQYVFSVNQQVDVTFDVDGKVIDVSRPLTESDLLNGKLYPSRSSGGAAE